MKPELNQQQLKQAQCQPCQGGESALNSEEVNEYMSLIDQSWTYQSQNQLIVRSFKFKGFAKTMFFVNALAHLADQQGHHPDVEFGYNYCRVKFTTHAVDGLTTNDFICAKQVDQLSQS